jgi:hypothetical protein
VKNGKRGPLYKHLSDFLWMKLVVLAIFVASLGLYSLIKTCGSSLELRRAQQQG